MSAVFEGTKDPVSEYLRLHAEEVSQRAKQLETIKKMGEAGLFGEIETDDAPLIITDDCQVETFRRRISG